MDYPKKVPGVGLVNGKFHDGDPANGIPGSLDPAAWANAVTDEMINVIREATLEPDEAKSDQLLIALRALFLGKTGTAADAEKLGGQLPAYYAKAADLAKAGGDPLLWPRTSPSRTHIQAGYAPLDGQELSRALYPDAWAAIQAGAVPVVTEAEWQADPLKRGAWTYGNGTTTFRMPDWNGKSAGSKGAVFVRGDGALSGGTPGLIQGDAIRNITAEFQDGAGTGGNAYYGVTGAFGVSTVDSGSGRTAGASTPLYKMSFDASRVVPTAAENRPLNVSSVWVCRLFGAVTNPGAADAAQLATEVARLWAQKLDLSAAFGLGQTWQSLTVGTQRVVGTTYYNTTGRPIMVSADGQSTGGGWSFGWNINGVNVGRGGMVTNGGAYATQTAIVPPGASYVLTQSGTSINSWQELR